MTAVRSDDSSEVWRSDDSNEVRSDDSSEVWIQDHSLLQKEMAVSVHSPPSIEYTRRISAHGAQYGKKKMIMMAN